MVDFIDLSDLHAINLYKDGLVHGNYIISKRKDSGMPDLGMKLTERGWVLRLLFGG